MNGVLPALARGLGDAFLTGPWERAAMLARAAEVVGARRRWLRPVVTQVLLAYPRPPRDRPRELAAFIADRPELRTAIAKAPAGRPVRARWIPQAPTQMAYRRPWPVPFWTTSRGLTAEVLGPKRQVVGTIAVTGGVQGVDFDHKPLVTVRFLDRAGKVLAVAPVSAYAAGDIPDPVMSWPTSGG